MAVGFTSKTRYVTFQHQTWIQSEKMVLSEFEAKWIEVINEKGIAIIIGVTYNRHRRKNDTVCIQYLHKVMKTIKKGEKLIQIVGDFNYNIMTKQIKYF